MVLVILRATPSAAGPLWLLGVAIWRTRCLYFGTLGNHFGISGAPRGSILPPRNHPGETWEQQDGLEVVVDRILSGFGVIFRPCFESFLGTEP